MIRTFFFLLLFFGCLSQAFTQKPFNCRGQYYLSLTRSNIQSSGLYEVKISPDGQKISLDTISSGLGMVLNAMGYRITDNFIYGMDPNRARLRRVGSDGVSVDLGIPEGIPIGPLYYAGDVTPDGRYLLLIGLSGTSTQIVKVDLEDPNFKCSFVPLQDKTVRIVDVAFDPFTGILYGHDFGNARLVTVNPETGAVQTDFVKQPLVFQLGALFFDSFGNLYGYGSYGNSTEDKFIKVDKKTGNMTLLAQGPVSAGQDGCACPFTLELQKTVIPQTAHPCTEVTYSFILSNVSGATRTGIVLMDSFPDHIVCKKVLRNPFGGNVSVSQRGFSISEMRVPVGIDTIRVLAEVSEVADGIYRNQAVLSGLPAALGTFTLSDNPGTLADKDATDLLIVPSGIDEITTDFTSCRGDSVLFDGKIYGHSYRWNDGSVQASRNLKSPGIYTATIKNVCRETLLTVSVSDQLLSINIPQDSLSVELGDSISFDPEYFSTNAIKGFEWISVNNPDVSCKVCPTAGVTPLRNGAFIITMVDIDGCLVSDTVFIRVSKNTDVFTSNIISANGDGYNDVFFIQGKPKAYNIEKLEIYDRWGSLVFVSQNFLPGVTTKCWDGSYNDKPVIAGVYVWRATLRFIDGTLEYITGNLTVIR
jgi:gliding motility-associated-like protein